MRQEFLIGIAVCEVAAKDVNGYYRFVVSSEHGAIREAGGGLTRRLPEREALNNANRRNS